jgi:hypothetical protein
VPSTTVHIEPTALDGTRAAQIRKFSEWPGTICRTENIVLSATEADMAGDININALTILVVGYEAKSILDNLSGAALNPLPKLPPLQKPLGRSFNMQTWRWCF